MNNVILLMCTFVSDIEKLLWVDFVTRVRVTASLSSYVSTMQSNGSENIGSENGVDKSGWTVCILINWIYINLIQTVEFVEVIYDVNDITEKLGLSISNLHFFIFWNKIVTLYINQIIYNIVDYNDEKIISLFRLLLIIFDKFNKLLKPFI